MGSVKRIGLVGLGSIGRRHLRVLSQIRPGVEVILVRSRVGGTWPEEALAKRTVDSLEIALEYGLDAAIISSPASFHTLQSLIFVRAGIPLLIEKPLSHSLDGVEALKQLAVQTRVPVLVGYVLRYSVGARFFKKLMSDGRIGKPLFAVIECGSYLPDWRPGQDYRTTVSAIPELGGGVLLELSHELDYANWFFGPFKNISAITRNSGTLDIKVEDIAVLSLLSQEDLPVSVHLDMCRRDANRRCIAYGSEGTLSWDCINNMVTWKPVVGEIEQWYIDFEPDAMFKSQLLHFLACVEQGVKPKVALDDGIATLRLVEAAKKSNSEGKLIAL